MLSPLFCIGRRSCRCQEAGDKIVSASIAFVPLATAASASCVGAPGEGVEPSVDVAPKTTAGVIVITFAVLLSSSRHGERTHESSPGLTKRPIGAHTPHRRTDSLGDGGGARGD